MALDDICQSAGDDAFSVEMSRGDTGTLEDICAKHMEAGVIEVPVITPGGGGNTYPRSRITNA